MHASISKLLPIARAWAQRALLWAMVAWLWLANSPLAWAAKKKAAEEAVATKSYTFPYILVMCLLGLGLMVICRPGSRKDKSDGKKDEAE